MSALATSLDRSTLSVLVAHLDRGAGRHPAGRDGFRGPPGRPRAAQLVAVRANLHQRRPPRARRAGSTRSANARSPLLGREENHLAEAHLHLARVAEGDADRAEGVRDFDSRRLRVGRRPLALRPRTTRTGPKNCPPSTRQPSGPKSTWVADVGGRLHGGFEREDQEEEADLACRHFDDPPSPPVGSAPASRAEDAPEHERRAATTGGKRRPACRGGPGSKGPEHAKDDQDQSEDVTPFGPSRGHSFPDSPALRFWDRGSR